MRLTLLGLARQVEGLIVKGATNSLFLGPRARRALAPLSTRTRVPLLYYGSINKYRCWYCRFTPWSCIHSLLRKIKCAHSVSLVVGRRLVDVIMVVCFVIFGFIFVHFSVRLSTTHLDRHARMIDDSFIH